MVWIFLALAAIAIALVKLGSLAVWVVILMMAFKASLFLLIPAVAIAGYYLYQYVTRRKS